MLAVTFDGAVVERTSHLRYLWVHWQNADLQTTCGNNSTKVQERSVSPEGYGYKWYWTRHLFLLYQSVALRVIDYGLGLTTMAQTNMLKLDRVQNEVMPVVLRTTKGTPIETVRFMLDLPPTQTRQKVDQVIAYFSAVINLHDSLWSRKRHKGVQTGTGQVLCQAEDSILQVCQPTELKQTKEWKRYPNWFRRLYETLLLENLEKCRREWPAGKAESEIKLLIQEYSRKQQTARPHSEHWWLCHQRPVRVGLHCQARCDYHSWRQCSLYGLNLQLDNGCGSSHPCPLLDCLRSWRSDHIIMPSSSQIHWACYKKWKKWNGKPRLECVHGRHSDWHVSMVDIHLRKLLRVYCPEHAAVTRNDQADRLAGKATLTSVLLLGISEVLRSLRHHLRTQSQEHHTIDRLKERGVKRGG